MKLAITVDNVLEELYLDGVLIPQQLPNYNNWEQVDVVDIPANAHVIAVKGRNVDVSSFQIND